MPESKARGNNQSKTNQQSTSPIGQVEVQPTTPDIKSIEPQASNQGAYDNQKPTLGRVMSWLLAYSQVVLSFLTFCVLLFTAIQWWESRRTREMEYRAYVGVKGVVLIKRPNDPQVSDLIVLYANTGRTPGLNGVIKTGWQPRESQLPDNVSYETDDVFHSKMALFPQLDMQTTINSQPSGDAPNPPPSASTTPAAEGSASTAVVKQQPLNVPPVKVIVQTRKYYAYGRIDYEDVFGRPHTTKFCYVNTPGTREWIQCGNYNDAN